MAVFVGEGDSSFCQVPSISTPLSPQNDHGCKILQISCGTSAAVALVGIEGRPTRLLEWGTGLYGERLSSPNPQTRKEESTGGCQHYTTELQPPLQLPTEVFTLPPRLSVRSIACGAHFVLAAAESGGCITWGGGRDPRSLGRGGCGSCISLECTTAAAPGVARPSSGMPDWVDKPLGAGGLKVATLAAGDDHAVAICADGTVWAWGRGDCGQLGCGAPLENAGAGGASHGSCVPKKVRIPGSLRPSATSAVCDRERPALALAAACGRDHSAVLTKGGHLWTFGSGLHGQVSSTGCIRALSYYNSSDLTIDSHMRCAVYSVGKRHFHVHSVGWCNPDSGYEVKPLSAAVRNNALSTWWRARKARTLEVLLVYHSKIQQSVAIYPSKHRASAHTTGAAEKYL